MDLSLTEDQLGFKALARDFLEVQLTPERVRELARAARRSSTRAG